MKNKKIVSLVLASTLTFSMLAGCKDAKEQETVTNENEKVSFSMTIMGGPKKPDSWLQKEVNKKLDAEIDFVMLPGWEELQVKTNLLMQDAERRPDIVWFTGMGTQLKQWKEAGIIKDWTPYLKNTENKNMLKKLTPEKLFASYDDGKIYTIPTDINGNGATMSTFVRKDWLDNLGLEAPKTVEEFVEVARAFTKNDPDGNGKDDTYGFGGQNSGNVDWRFFSPIFYAYGYDPSAFGVYTDGTVKLGATVPETKEALKVLRDMYAEGLIEPTIFTGNDLGQLIAKNKVGMFYSWQAYYSDKDTTNKALKANVPEAELLPLDPIVGPEGLSGDYPEPLGSWCKIALTDHAKDPQGVVDTLDKMMTPEIGMLNEYGEEGTHYVMEDGRAKRLISEEEKNDLGLGSLGWIWFGNLPEEKEEKMIELEDKRAKTADQMRERYIHYNLSVRENMPTYVKYMTDIDDMTKEVFVGIITGQKSLDEYDKFVETYYSNFEGEQIEKEATELYSREKEEFEKFKEFYNKEFGEQQ